MKNLITGSDFINLCKKGALAGGYLFFDDEEYMKRHCIKLAKKTVLEEDSADFNYIKIDCEENKNGWMDALLDFVETPAMFAPKKLIVVTGYNVKDALSLPESERILEALESGDDVVAIFVCSEDGFDYGRLPRTPSALYKKAAQSLVPVRFERQSGAKLNGWVAKRFSAEGIICDAPSASAMVEYVSPNMDALALECDKLICYIKSLGENKVTEEYIYRVCVPMKIEGEFDLSNALLDGDYLRCVEIIASMKRRKERPEVAYTQIGGYVSTMYTVKVFSDGGNKASDIAAKTGMHEYRVGMYLSALQKRRLSAKRLGVLVEKCSEADRRIKSTGLESFGVLQELVYEVCR